MSFQAYPDAVKFKTRKAPADFAKLASQKGLTKHDELVAWLKADFGLGHGHATAIAGVVLKSGKPLRSATQKMDELFAGTKAVWRAPCDTLIAKVMKFGPDIEASANSIYVNLLHGKKKFGILQPASAARLDIGIKLKGQRASGRCGPAGKWNAMVTHRVRVESAKDIDDELLGWLELAYEAA
jgi:Domain of unknown function (DUF4287)/Domain of unknown function (DUF5655)